MYVNLSYNKVYLMTIYVPYGTSICNSQHPAIFCLYAYAPHALSQAPIIAIPTNIGICWYYHIYPSISLTNIKNLMVMPYKYNKCALTQLHNITHKLTSNSLLSILL